MVAGADPSSHRLHTMNGTPVLAGHPSLSFTGTHRITLKVSNHLSEETTVAGVEPHMYVV